MKKYRRRARFTEAEKIRMWERWQQGDSLHTIAHLLDTSHTSVRRPPSVASCSVMAVERIIERTRPTTLRGRGRAVRSVVSWW